jgi:DNA repair exonuclease SbcCD ATPase subunit
MKKIKFKNLSIQNFLSVGDKKLKLNFQDGINLITGLNKDKESKNGCGKTTILDALYWNIFGNTIRDIKKDKIVHNHSKDNCLVELEFDLTSLDGKTTEYKIERSLNPSKVHLYKKEVDTTYSTIQKTDEAIIELIGANEELFRNSVLMSLDNTLPFMAQKKVEKRKFIESILQINVFSEMLSKVRQDYNDLKKEYDISSSLFSEKQKTISFFNEQKIKNQQIKDQKIETLKNKIKENEERLKTNQNQTLIDTKVKFEESLKKTENAIQKIEEKISKTSESLLEFSKKEAVFHTEIENIEKQIRSLKNKTGICPTCKKKLSDEDDSSIEEHLNELSVDKNTKKQEFDSISKQRHEISNEKNNFVKKQKELNDLYRSLNQKIISIDVLIKENSTINDKNLEIQESIDSLLKEKDHTEDKIKEIEESVKELEEKLTNQQQKLNILENSKLIVSEEGVKTHIIKKLLVFFNNKLNFYLKKLEAPCSCNFDEYFEETIVNENKKECSYFNFSGGERKRIDLAILFTFQDILKSQSGIYYSLNMYDELFDSALDEAGTNKVLEILKDKSEKYKESIYIISHNPSVSKNNIDNIINLEKINGKTRIAI